MDAITVSIYLYHTSESAYYSWVRLLMRNAYRNSLKIGWAMAHLAHPCAPAMTSKKKAYIGLPFP